MLNHLDMYIKYLKYIKYQNRNTNMNTEIIWLCDQLPTPHLIHKIIELLSVLKSWIPLWMNFHIDKRQNTKLKFETSIFMSLSLPSLFLQPSCLQMHQKSPQMVIDDVLSLVPPKLHNLRFIEGRKFYRTWQPAY